MENQLEDLEQITIDPDLSGPECMAGYLEQMGNPYCFLCGDVPVRISFVNEDQTLSQVLIQYFSGLT